MFKTLSALSVAAPLLFGIAHAQTQPYQAVGEAHDLTVDIGGGAVYGFSANGGDPEKVNAIPWIDFNYKNRFYGDALNGVGYNLILRDRLRAGVQIRPHFGGNADGLEGLEVPGLGADLAGYAFYRVGENFSLGGRLMHDVSNVSNGSSLFLSAGHQDITRVGLLQTLVYTRFGDRKTNQAYYGIDESEAAATGLSPYEVGAGAQNVGIAFLMMTPIKKHYAIATFLNAERALGDVADSPLIQLKQNKEMSYRAGILVVRRFSR
ncbi:MAG: MipA/OmpV family protein [Asticcacaulis sp.]|uniref:MipA/OmpV family protein n=1 Tax=Asticcacaulis sp. TaxID=1872648 RepID=UPI0039E2A022